MASRSKYSPDPGGEKKPSGWFRSLLKTPRKAYAVAKGGQEEAHPLHTEDTWSQEGNADLESDASAGPESPPPNLSADASTETSSSSISSGSSVGSVLRPPTSSPEEVEKRSSKNNGRGVREVDLLPLRRVDSLQLVKKKAPTVSCGPSLLPSHARKSRTNLFGTTRKNTEGHLPEKKGGAELRVVSLLGAATEIVVALGLERLLVGRSHECKNIQAVEALPCVTSPGVVQGSQLETSLAEADSSEAIVRKALSRYEVDAKAIFELEPDIIITQDACDVCAVTSKDLEEACAAYFKERSGLGLKPGMKIVSLKPMTVNDIWNNVLEIASALGEEEKGHVLVQSLRTRWSAINQLVPAGRSSPGVDADGSVAGKPRVACLQWVAPLMGAGYWVPGIVACAGGKSVTGQAGEPTAVLSLPSLAALDPDVVVLMCCGLSLRDTLQRLALLPAEERRQWDCLQAVQRDRVFVADGDRFFNTSSPAIVDSAELLLEILHVTRTQTHWSPAPLGSSPDPSRSPSSQQPRSPRSPAHLSLGSTFFNPPLYEGSGFIRLTGGSTEAWPQCPAWRGLLPGQEAQGEQQQEGGGSLRERAPVDSLKSLEEGQLSPPLVSRSTSEGSEGRGEGRNRAVHSSAVQGLLSARRAGALSPARPSVRKKLVPVKVVEADAGAGGGPSNSAPAELKAASNSSRSSRSSSDNSSRSLGSEEAADASRAAGSGSPMLQPQLPSQSAPQPAPSPPRFSLYPSPPSSEDEAPLTPSGAPQRPHWARVAAEPESASSDSDTPAEGGRKGQQAHVYHSAPVTPPYISTDDSNTALQAYPGAVTTMVAGTPYGTAGGGASPCTPAPQPPLLSGLALKVAQLRALVLATLEMSLPADCLLLSGGLSSTVLAHAAASVWPGSIGAAVTVLASRKAADRQPAAAAARACQLPHVVVGGGPGFLPEHLLETELRFVVRVLRTFDPAEIRSGIVLAAALREAKRHSCASVLVGDGADELFTAFDFMARMSDAKLLECRQHIIDVLRFPCRDLALALGLEVRQPFLHPALQEFALQLSKAELFGADRSAEWQGFAEGNLLLRMAFPEVIAARRPKDPVEVGAGTASLSRVLARRMPREEFLRERAKVQAQDGVTLRDAEQLHYYRAFRQVFGGPDIPGVVRWQPNCCHACGYPPLFPDQLLCATCGECSARAAAPPPPLSPTSSSSSDSNAPSAPLVPFSPPAPVPFEPHMAPGAVQVQMQQAPYVPAHIPAPLIVQPHGFPTPPLSPGRHSPLSPMKPPPSSPPRSPGSHRHRSNSGPPVFPDTVGGFGSPVPCDIPRSPSGVSHRRSWGQEEEDLYRRQELNSPAGNRTLHQPQQHHSSQNHQDQQQQQHLQQQHAAPHRPLPPPPYGRPDSPNRHSPLGQRHGKGAAGHHTISSSGSSNNGDSHTPVASHHGSKVHSADVATAQLDGTPGGTVVMAAEVVTALEVVDRAMGGSSGGTGALLSAVHGPALGVDPARAKLGVGGGAGSPLIGLMTCLDDGLGMWDAFIGSSAQLEGEGEVEDSTASLDSHDHDGTPYAECANEAFGSASPGLSLKEIGRDLGKGDRGRQDRIGGAMEEEGQYGGASSQWGESEDFTDATTDIAGFSCDESDDGGDSI